MVLFDGNFCIWYFLYLVVIETISSKQENQDSINLNSHIHTKHLKLNNLKRKHSSITY